MSLISALGYKINERTFADLKKRFSKDYANLNIPLFDMQIVYSGAEHTGYPKLPNITLLPNINLANEEIVAGQTMGHQHTQYEKGDKRRFQEIYEFKTSGAMLVRNPSGVFLHVLSPDEKLVLGTADDMTIINLCPSPLITLDYANPNMNSASSTLENEIGPLILPKFEEKGLVFYVNQEYANKGIVPFNSEPIITHFGSVKNLCHGISKKEREFEKHGIKIRLGGNIPEDLKEEFNKPLLELALVNGLLHKILEF